MKALLIDGEYYSYPKEVKNFAELKSFIDKNYNSYVVLKKLSSDNTVPPFFIDEYSCDVYVNIANCQCIEEKEVTVMSKNDYKTSLNNAIDEICFACDSFNMETRTCDCGDIQNNLCLNGNCEVFTLADEDDNF
jgi:hypothetical protein